MWIALLLAVLAVALVAAGIRLRAVAARAGALDAERARLTAEGATLRGEVAARDVTLAELRESEERYRALVEGAEDWVWESDASGTLTFSNAAGAALLGLDDLVGRSAAELTHPADRPVVTTPDGWSGVVRRRHADGSWRTVDSRSVPVRSESGELVGFRGIDRDLTAAPPPRPAEPERRGVAIVRWPIVDGQREVVGYELVGDGRVVDAFEPSELVTLGAGRPVWVSVADAGEGVPRIAPESAVLQLTAAAPSERARALRAAGYSVAIEDFDGDARLLEHCDVVKVRVAGRGDDELRGLLAEPAARGATLVATGVASGDEFTRCRVLGFARFEGDFFARPRGEGDGGVASGALASLETLAELTSAGASFEDLERTIGADVGLSLSLLRYVNSAFFSLPREIDSVHEALTLLGTRAVRRWATVMALSAVPDAPEDLVALALLRARMCELIGGPAMHADERDRLFTVGLFSVADALLDAPMEDVLASLPFSAEIAGALLRYEGRKGRLLATVIEYERGHFPPASDADAHALAEAYLEALKWADQAGRSLR